MTATKTWICNCMGWMAITEAATRAQAKRNFRAMASSASLLPSDIDELDEVDMDDGDGIREASFGDIAHYRAMTGPIVSDPPRPTLANYLRGKVIHHVEQDPLGGMIRLHLNASVDVDYVEIMHTNQDRLVAYLPDGRELL